MTCLVFIPESLARDSIVKINQHIDSLNERSSDVRQTAKDLQNELDETLEVGLLFMFMLCIIKYCSQLPRRTFCTLFVVLSRVFALCANGACNVSFNFSLSEITCSISH